MYAVCAVLVREERCCVADTTVEDQASANINGPLPVGCCEETQDGTQLLVAPSKVRPDLVTARLPNETLALGRNLRARFRLADQFGQT